MDNHISDSEKFDVRMLSLKRWNIPQTTSIFSKNYDSQAKPPQFISFQSHHFIDVTDSGINIPSAYAKVTTDHSTEIHNQELQNVFQDIHTVQNITLLGKSGNFWGTPHSVMYITFIQLTNKDALSFKFLEKKINSIITATYNHASNQHKESPEWALYYSLDFCDYILFIKNISLKVYHDILWKLTIYRKRSLATIRDTYTLYTFSYDFLARAYNKIDSCQEVVFDDQASLSINLSIQALPTWLELKKTLVDLKIPYKAYRLSGRYDLNIITGSVKFTQIFEVIRIIDTLCDRSPDEVFGSYEIIPMTALRGRSPKHGELARQDLAFMDIACKVMDSLYRDYLTTDTVSANYVYETKQSIRALLKNGFSEEFVLSIFMSFISFLKISLEIHKLIEDCTDKGRIVQLNRSLEKIKRGYFTALNTLSLCTMHNERQFIQAPAFNATYFDVPPKLLSYYNAIAYTVTAHLLSVDEPPYRFVIAPDYREDINVISLDGDCKEALSEHLAVIYLCERDFYNPEKAIKLITHEIGHYVGNRFRAERAIYIFRSISYHFLCQNLSVMKITNDVSSVLQETSVVSILAHSLADFMQEQYTIYMKKENLERTRGIEYHLSDITRFLRTIQFGLSFFEDSNYIEEITDKWIDALTTAANEMPSVKQELELGLCSINAGLSTTTFFDAEHVLANSDIFVRMCISKIPVTLSTHQNSKSTLALQTYMAFCEAILQIFSEAYADLRMIEIFGDSITHDEYEALLISGKDTVNTHKLIRHDAVCQVLWDTGIWRYKTPMNPLNKAERISYAATINQISHYLDKCHNDHSCAELIKSYRIFHENNIVNQIKLIQKTILEYRSTLFNYCNDFLNSQD